MDSSSFQSPVNPSPPILLYHKVTPHWEAGVTWVLPSLFTRQMQHLHNKGWQAVPLSDWNGGERQFVLAFDDGYDCIEQHALPVLERLNFRATIFVPTGYVGKWNDWDYQFFGRRFKHLDAAALKDLNAAGWELGSHSVGHRSLLELTAKQAESELRLSKSYLEDLTSKPVESVSFPFGRYDSGILAAALGAGYRRAIVPQRISDVPEQPGLDLFEADAVYLWDGTRLEGRLRRDSAGYRVGKRLRRFLNRASGGTIVWRKIFPVRR